MKKTTKNVLYLGFSLLLIGLMYAAFNYHSNIPIEELKARYTDESSHFVELVGMEVHYQVSGTGQPLVLLHGTGASVHTWDGWVASLSKDFQIIRLDLPGFGLTGKHYGNNYSIQSYSDFLEAFVSKMGLDHFHLAGNSLGGHIAWHYALDHPNRVNRLVLLDATGYTHPDDQPPLAFRLAQNLILGKLMLRITPRSLFERSLREVYADDGKVTGALVDRYFDLFLRRGNRQAFVDRVKEKFVDRSAEIADIQAPTLILWGEADHWVPVTDAARFKEDLPNAELIIYPEVGHVPMEEIPEQSAQDVRQFLLAGSVGEQLVDGQ
ncbi:MAG: alpha/beta hydrolase [Bacteroidota bacterium]